MTAKGLEGVVVADSRLSRVDGVNGRLTIAGYEVQELAGKAVYEEVIHLLLKGRLPRREELNNLNTQLNQNRKIPYQVLSLIDSIANSIGMEPMGALRTAMSALAVDSTDPNDRSEEAEMQRAVHIVSAMPTIVAAFARIRRKLSPIEPREDLSHAANFLWMLTGKEPQAVHVKALDTYLVCVSDHGMNASTFTSRIIVSTRSDLYSAVTAAVASLKGLLHGGAPSAVLEMFEAIGSLDNAEQWVRREINAGRRIMGIGHRVYKVRDPRALVLYSLSREIADKTGDRRIFDLAEGVEKIIVRVLDELKPGRKLYANVEFYTATLLHALGIPADLYTCVFAIGRSAGWMAHAMEQLQDNRLIRPLDHYTGPEGLVWVPVDKR